ncbi:helix-loop-helix DNA-binding domain-containing protein [Aphelenchoides avenae]|nr:helix-loop-helix DNA-binding domain-containing protein [Aphelenchus avenae]
MSTPSASSDSDDVPRKMSRASALSDDQIEPYVRKRRSSADSERLRKRMQCLSEEEQNQMRTTINSRERKRMHDLNDALDDLRGSLPYEPPNSRKHPKITTIMLATNHIKRLEQQIEQLRRENEELKARLWQNPEQRKLADVELAGSAPPTNEGKVGATDLMPAVRLPAPSIVPFLPTAFNCIKSFLPHAPCFCVFAATDYRPQLPYQGRWCVPQRAIPQGSHHRAAPSGSRGRSKSRATETDGNKDTPPKKSRSQIGTFVRMGTMPVTR